MDKETNEKKKRMREKEVKVDSETKEKRVNKKNLGMNVAKCIVVVLFVIAIAYLIIAFSKTGEEKLAPAPNTTIDYNLLNVETSNGNIVMENDTNAEVKDGVKRNTSSKLLEEKTYNDMKIKDARIEAAGGMSQFTATVENPYDKNIEGEIVNVVFINEDGTELARVETFFPDLEPNSISEINASTDMDIATAYDFYIEAK